MAEVKCFQHSKNCTKKNINYLRIQRFKRLIHWFHFDPVRDLSHLLIVKTFLLHSAAEFLCERKSSIFWRRQKSCSIHHRQIRLRTPKERAVFSDCLERIWSPQSLSHQPTKYSATPPTQQIFLPPRFWVVMWPAATRVFLPTTKGGREERPWERGWAKWLPRLTSQTDSAHSPCNSAVNRSGAYFLNFKNS